MSWKKVKLGELITESKIPSENPDPDRRITVRLNVLGVEKRPLENEKAGATKQFIRKAGQFIYGKQNFHKGAFGIIPVELDGFESSADLPSFDVREDCLPEWIFYFFKQGGYYLELAKIARGVATQRIHPEQIYDLEIPLPDVETQKKIIASIKAIEGKGEKLKNHYTHQLTLLDSLNQAILQEAVQGKLVKQDPKDEPASELLKRIKLNRFGGQPDPNEKNIGLKPINSGINRTRFKPRPIKELPPIKPEEIPFEIPDNWVWCRLGEICDNITKGSSPNWQGVQYVSEKEGILFITSKNVDCFKIDLTKATYVEEKFNEIEPRSILKKGDILTNIVGASIGRTALFELDVVANINQAVCILRIEHNLINKDYLLNLMNSNLALKLMTDSSFAPGRANLSMGNIANFTIPLPPLSEQKRIVAEIEKQFAKTKQLKEHIIANQQATEQLLKALLHQAFEVKEMEEVNS